MSSALLAAKVFEWGGQGNVERLYGVPLAYWSTARPALLRKPVMR